MIPKRIKLIGLTLAIVYIVFCLIIPFFYHMGRLTYESDTLMKNIMLYGFIIILFLFVILLYWGIKPNENLIKDLNVPINENKLEQEHLEEIKKLLIEHKSLTLIKKKIQGWKNEGYIVDELEEMIEEAKNN